MISYLIIAMLPALSIMLIFSILTTRSARRTLCERIDASNNLVSMQFDALLDNMSFLSLDLLSDTSFVNSIKLLTYNNGDPAVVQKNYLQITSKICTYALAASAYDVTFLNDAKGYIATSKAYNSAYSAQTRLDKSRIAEIDWLSEARSSDGRAVLIPVQMGAFSSEGDEPVLTLVRSIRIPTEIVGYLMIEVSHTELDSILNIGEQNGTHVAIIGENGKPIYASADFPLAEDCTFPELTALQTDYLVSSEHNADTGITVLSVMDNHDVSRNVLSTILPAFGVWLLLVILTVSSIRILTVQFSRPITLLTEEMRDTTLRNLKDNSQDQEFEKYEEIQYLHNQFNQMRQRLDTMIQNEIAAKTLQIREHLKSLQSQINPHFLYNTLNVIGIMGLEEGSSHVYDACMQLSSVFRYSIADKNKGIATIEEEMNNAEAYLELMRMRFEHRFSYQLFCDPQVRDAITPRLILQPFIENIFSHAYDAEHTVISAEIRADRHDDRWILSIEDDGAGMPPGMAEQLSRQAEAQVSLQDRSTGSIGIVNTLLRMKLYYQGDFEFCIQNKAGSGLLILLSAPIQRKENPYAADQSFDC